MILKLFSILFILLIFLSTLSCKACKKEVEPEVTISSKTLYIEGYDEEPEVKKSESKIKRIEIGPSGRSEEPAQLEGEKPEFKPVSIAGLPPETYEETDLSARLREKMAEAYSDNEESIPDVKIYISEMKYDEFVNYYRGLGYKVHTVAVPATQVIEPVLEQRPEVAEKINMADYEEVVIHQVMIDDAGISAADKYIDPDTFEIIEKTFVTKMKK